MSIQPVKEAINLTAFYLRGQPGSFVDIARAEDVRAAASMELQEQSWTHGIGGYKLPARVLPAGRWWEYYAHSTIHAACVDAKARDIVGGGYTIGGDGISGPTLELATAIIERSIDDLTDACRDWETTGWANLELLPTLGGELYKLNHIDSWTCWPAEDNQAIIHMRDRKWVRYVPLGVREPGAYQLAHLNNNHWYKNTYYGVPDVSSTIIQIESSYEALKQNQEFFARRGGYHWLLLMQNTGPGSGKIIDPTGESEQRLVTEINYTVKKSGKDSDTDMLILPMGNRTATLHKLDADFKDMDFPQMLAKYDQYIRIAHSVPGVRIGLAETGALSGSQAAEQLSAYAENVIRPKQRRWNQLITAILREWVDPRIEFRFDPLEVSEVAKIGHIVANLWKNLLLTRTEARAMLGFEPLRVDGGGDYTADELFPEGSYGNIGGSSGGQA